LVPASNLERLQDSFNGFTSLQPELGLNSDVFHSTLDDYFNAEYGWMDVDNAFFIGGDDIPLTFPETV
jgi:hypothetical protein